MEWFVEEPERAKVALTFLVLLITGMILWFGRKSLGVAIACALVFLFFAALTGPSIIPARRVAQRNACIANLKAIQAAKTDWAKENAATNVPTVQDLFGAGKFLREAPACPRGGEYTIGAVEEKATCSLTAKGHRLD